MSDSKGLKEIKEALETWRQKNKSEFKKERKREFVTDEGIPIERVYTPLHLEERGFNYLKDCNLPGEFPYTRHSKPSGYRKELWGSAMVTGRPTAKDLNDLWKILIAQGNQALYVLYDMPTHLCRDPDDPLARADVGRIGVSMSSLRDWEIAFEGIDLEKHWINIQANAQAAWETACFLELAKERRVDLGKLGAAIQNDILKEFFSRGTYVFPPGPSIRLTTDVTAFCHDVAPNLKTIQLQSYAIADAGAKRPQEVAFALSDAITYIEAAKKRGIDVDTIAPRIAWICECSHVGFFEEIAKFRAMRKVWARIVKERFKAKRPESMQLWAWSRNRGNSITKEQYLVNIARTGISSLANALAGVQQMDGTTYDEPWGVPTTEALITALRCQQVVAYETGVTDTVDPLGGSYYLECLTKEYEERILEEIDRIDKKGGVISCIENGYMAREISKAAYEEQKKLESGEKLRVGHNIFTMPEPPLKRPRFRASPEVLKRRAEDLAELRRKRDNQKVRKLLDEIKSLALQEESAESNLVPAMMEAARAYATTGEVHNVLREVWGEFKEAPF